METKKTYKILTLILIMQWALIQILAQYPLFIENYYSNGLYIYISKFSRFILSWIPFSIGDLMYAFFIIYIVKSIYKAIKTKQFNLKNTLFKIGGIASVVFFIFQLNWGLNYLREPLYYRLNFKKNTYTANELYGFTEKLITKVNEVQLSITHNDTVVVENPISKKEIKNEASFAYNQLQKKHHQFIYSNPEIKHSLFSLPLTYMGFAGYLNPITNEAQVNYLIPKNSYPATVCHEIAHQLGIASEKEANFVGYLAATNANNTYYNYSGYLMALKYCLYEIYQNEPDKFDTLKATLNKGVLKDMQQHQDFWQSYQNWSEQFFKIFYDSYLKANKQEAGIYGYNKVILLLINYHLTEKL
ncbi:DUF3810 domain-containing protein [Lutibacter sp. HS1-25]|uniref:DUF3810 domain-containing protein n=1 Tax=Lutibacter sp. HS1-25 TaxID=2485000 RepID=UPI0010109A3F|nr:DUF3810 domain-containing protein [Lutibacter sp. HS1-25]RXP55117.1 DUF3810 domain-containing protein [Lutibacter sp. HS1-25]